MPEGKRAGFNFTGPLAGLGNTLLGQFGVESASKAPINAQAGPKVDPVKSFAAKGIPLEVQLWVGARLPFAAFVTILGFFTYFYHIVPIVPWLLSGFSILFGIIVCWPPNHIGARSRGVADWGMMGSWFLAVGFAVVLGLVNYGLLESWVNVTFLREYKDLKADISPVAVMDAGILSFGKDVTLATTMSAGYKFWFYNYCAAPIVGKDPTAVPVTYWAVGVGCCDARGEFRCDSAEDKDARSAVPLRPYTVGKEIASHYDKAIMMSAAANELEVAKDKVFVLWYKDPKKAGQDMWWLCTGLFIMLTLCAFCAYIGCVSAFTHMSVMQKVDTD